MLTKRDKLRKRFKRAVNFFNARVENTMPLFIFGEMRSGTNMLTECLDKSMSTEVFNEIDEEAFDSYVLRADAVIEELIARSRVQHVVFKSLADSARAAEVLKRFPGSKGVWIFRRYADVVNSALRKWVEHNKYLHYILYEPQIAAWRGWNLSSSQLELIERHYKRGISEASARALIWYVRNNHYFEQELDKSDRVRLVSYEDMVLQPAKHLSRVFEFLNLQFSDSYVDRVTTSSIGKSAAPEFDGEIESLCRGLKERFDVCWQIQNEDGQERGD